MRHATRQRGSLTLAALALGGGSFAFLQSLVIPALPDIQKQFHAATGTVAWVASVFLLSASVMTPVLGRLGDTYGKHRILLVAVGALGLGSVVGALATSMAVLIAARAIQGAGSAIFPLSYAIIRDEFPRARAASAIGLLTGLLNIGGTAGILLSGPIVDTLGYRWLFWLPLIPISLCLVGCVRWVPASPPTVRTRVDVVGAFVLSGWVACALIAITEGVQSDFGRPHVLLLCGAAVALFFAWVSSARRAEHPLVDLNMLRSRGVWPSNLLAATTGAGMLAFFVAVPLFVQGQAGDGFGFGVDVAQAGLVLLPTTLLIFVASAMAAKVAARSSWRTPLFAGAAALTISYGWLLASHSHLVDFYIAAGMVGVALGLMMASLPFLIIEAVPADRTGVATGVNFLCRNLGGAVGSQVAGSILAASAVAGATASLRGFEIVFVMGAGIGLVSLLIVIFVPARLGSAPDPGASLAVVDADDARAVVVP